MRVKDLIDKLSKYEDFELEFVFINALQERYTVRSFKVDEITDIGHSDKVILLSGKENE